MNNLLILLPVYLLTFVLPYLNLSRIKNLVEKVKTGLRFEKYLLDSISSNFPIWFCSSYSVKLIFSLCKFSLYKRFVLSNNNL